MSLIGCLSVCLKNLFLHLKGIKHLYQILGLALPQCPSRSLLAATKRLAKASIYPWFSLVTSCGAAWLPFIAAIAFCMVAVGMPVARHPPHRSVRAELPHTAPTLDDGADALSGVWCKLSALANGDRDSVRRSQVDRPRWLRRLKACRPRAVNLRRN